MNDSQPLERALEAFITEITGQPNPEPSPRAIALDPSGLGILTNFFSQLILHLFLYNHPMPNTTSKQSMGRTIQSIGKHLLSISTTAPDTDDVAETDLPSATLTYKGRIAFLGNRNLSLKAMDIYISD